MQKIVLVPTVKECILGTGKIKFNKINYNDNLSEYEKLLLSKYVDKNINNHDRVGSQNH